MKFNDRTQAGQQLAKKLLDYKDQNTVIYALPRGGIEVAVEIARALNVPLDLIIARKIGYPGWAEYAIGAVTETSQPVWNEQERQAVKPDLQEKLINQERQEARRRRLKYLGDRKPISATNKIAIIVDDGIATGLTVMAAAQELRAQKPKQIIIAAPVAPKDSIKILQNYADKIVVLNEVPSLLFGAIGSFYRKFNQVQDQEVQDIMAQFGQKE